MQYGNTIARDVNGRYLYVFKSYYVVWKQRLLTTELQVFPSLNRTMQYGNERIICTERSVELCLNRTMQYGNFIKYIITDKEKKFKSYYVVWKLKQNGQCIE